MTCLRTTLFSLCALAVAVPGSTAESVDTSAWVCEYCPFEAQSGGSYALGATTVSDDTAMIGNATGYDEDGVYANLDARGRKATDRYRVRWNIEDLGLDSRVVSVDGSQPGRFDYHLDWEELPYRQFNTTSTVFSGVADGGLALPPDWVRAPTTAGFSALDANLVGRSIASDRRTFGLGGRYRLSPALSVAADYRQRNNEGTRIAGGSTFNNASLLPADFDHRTDELELSIRYGSDSGFLRASWFLSDFDNAFETLQWEQPFSAAAGAGFPALARAPDNRFQQLRIAGGYSLPAWRTVVTVSAALGRIEQDEPFLDYTTNPTLDPGALPRPDLGGEVDTRNVVLSVNARPLRKLRLRGSYRYDERDNNTPVELYSRVVADTFLGGEEEANSPFSHRRRKFEGSADWDAHRMLRLSTGFEYREHDRTLQEVSEQEELVSFGRARLRPLQGIELDARFGNSRREIDRYDEALAIDLGQNPLLRKYNLAYRFREFADLRASWSPATLPISVTVTGLWADDSYTQSQLGLTSGEEQSFSADFSWYINDRASVFLNAGLDNLQADQFGSESFAAPDWRAETDDDFTSFGGGFTVDEIAGKLDLRVSALSSRGESEITLLSAAAGTDAFPDLSTDLDRLRLDLRYRYSDRVDINVSAMYQRFRSSDWALQGLRPDAAPQLFSLDAEPYDEENMMFTIGARYRMEP